MIYILGVIVLILFLMCIMVAAIAGVMVREMGFISQMLEQIAVNIDRLDGR